MRVAGSPPPGSRRSGYFAASRLGAAGSTGPRGRWALWALSAPAAWDGTRAGIASPHLAEVLA